MENHYGKNEEPGFYEDLRKIDEKIGTLYIGVDKFGEGLFRSDEEGFYFYLKKDENNLPKEISDIVNEGELSKEEISFDNVKVFPKNIQGIFYEENKPIVYLNQRLSKN